MQQEKLEIAVNHLRTRISGMRAVYVYGSLASGETHPNSDIDLAVLAEQSVDTMTRMQLAGELAELLGLEVDLIDLAAVPTVMRMQVVGKGRRLFGGPDPGLEEYESRIFSDYARLNEERAGILHDVMERGSVL